MKKKAVVLLSGGLDSSTVLYYAVSKGYDCRALIFDYGQKHKKEIEAAKKIARLKKVPFTALKIALPWKGSALLDGRIKVPSGRKMDKSIPSTYVPARNTIFISFAMSLAEASGASEIFIGANALDYSGYPDCRPLYYRVYNELIKVGTKKGVEGKTIKISTPLISMTKAGIIRLGLKLGVPYQLTWSCYEGGKKPCGKCDSCVLRAKGFSESGVI